jgi:hypothetical protein
LIPRVSSSQNINIYHSYNCFTCYLLYFLQLSYCFSACLGSSKIMSKWSFLFYISHFPLRWPSLITDILFLCFLLVDAQERSRLVQSRWRSWVRNLILLCIWISYLIKPPYQLIQPDGIKSDLFRFIMQVLLIIKFPRIYFM